VHEKEAFDHALQTCVCLFYSCVHSSSFKFTMSYVLASCENALPPPSPLKTKLSKFKNFDFDNEIIPYHAEDICGTVVDAWGCSIMILQVGTNPTDWNLFSLKII